MENNTIQNKYEKMKSPLGYQTTEYDCGQATFLNAIKYLFHRGEIQPIVIKYITQYTLDTVNIDGHIGKCGTSEFGMEYLAIWLNEHKKSLGINIDINILKEDEVTINNDKLYECINKGGVAILRVWSDCEHYVLCTGIDEEYVYIFDPYYLEDGEYDDDIACTMVFDKPFEYNRIVNRKRLDEESKQDFSIVKNKNSRIILINRI